MVNKHWFVVLWYLVINEILVRTVSENGFISLLFRKDLHFLILIASFCFFFGNSTIFVLIT